MKLLLVEDDRIVRIPVRDALKAAGYLVTECADGSAALRAIESEAFDMVLSDARLPGLDGISLFRKILHAQPDVAVLLMTAHAVHPPRPRPGRRPPWPRGRAARDLAQEPVGAAAR